jgi:thiamine-phosphate pyrophosphorylase
VKRAEQCARTTLAAVLRCAIIDCTFRATDASRLAADGVNFIQLRDKSAEPRTLVRLAHDILQQLRNTGTQLLINTRADIALCTAAHGVHLTTQPNTLTPAQIRTLYAHANLPKPTVSISCHTLAEVACAREREADLILFGPVFEKHITQDKTLPGIGLSQLAAACRAAGDIPVLALGGVTTKNAQSCINAGAQGIAAIRLFA